MRRGLIIIAAALLFPMTAHAEEIPAEVRAVAEELCSDRCVCPELVEAIACSESHFTVDIISSDGGFYGLCQVSPWWNRYRMAELGVTKSDLLTIRGNLMVAVDLLADLFEEYEDPVEVLLQYGGFSEAKKWKYRNEGVIPAYIQGVLERSARYEEEHRKERENDANR